MHELSKLLLEDIKKVSFLGEQVKVVAINHQGLSNSAFQLTYEGQHYFLKELTSNNFVLLDRESLFELQKKLSNKRLAPRPVYLDPKHRFQIDEWIAGDDFTCATLSQEQKLLGLANILADTHTCNIKAPQLNLLRALQHYSQRIKLENSQHLSEQLDSFEYQYQQTNESVLCHNDLSLAHCYSLKENLAFDWEYSAVGNRFFDVASCIEINKLNGDDAELLVALYIQESKRRKLESRYSDKQVVENINTMRPIVTFTNDLWVLASQS
jgi:thiamine kinase-like enzyme